MYFSLRLFASICCIFSGKCYHFITSFFPSKRNMDLHHVLQMNEENWLIGNKRTEKLHCLLIPYHVPKAVSPITDATNSPCTASSFLCTLLTSIFCCESAVCPSRLGLSPLSTYGFALLSATCTWQAKLFPGSAWLSALGSWVWMGEKREAADLSRRDGQMGLDTKVWSRCPYWDLRSFWKDRKAPM